MKLALALIRTDGGTQTRAEIDLVVAAQYADLWRENPAIEWRDPIVVFYDGTAYWLADGFHRVTGARSASVVDVECDVRQGTRRDAILFSVGANAKHGLRRTNADKRRAVETLLRDEEWSGWSDRKIAAVAGVSNTLVGEIRRICQPLTDTRIVERSGVTYQQNTSKIGRREPVPVEPIEDAPESAPTSPPASNVVPMRAAPTAVSSSSKREAFDVDARELRRVLTEARNLADRLVERGAGLGSVVRAGRLADVRRSVAEALKSLGEVKVAV